MELKTDHYQLTYSPKTATVYFSGAMRLRGEEAYQPVHQFLQQVFELAPPVLTLDITGLNLLNSSGLVTLMRFAIVMQDQSAKLIMRGVARVSWHAKALDRIAQMAPQTILELLEDGD